MTKKLSSYINFCAIFYIVIIDLDVVQEEKENDKNYEEPSSFSSKSSWNFFNGYGFFGWLNKWRSGDATTSSLQGEGVNRTQETLQRETVGCPQKRENTNDREEEARRVPSQVKTTKLESKIFYYTCSFSSLCYNSRRIPLSFIEWMLIMQSCELRNTNNK